jgi:hypothetical protein
MIQEIQISS